MHLLLTDLLVCPRCGPGFGLILLGDRIEERRVLEGTLGCPNCRERYPVEAGFADLRAPPRPPLPPVVEVPEPEADEERVLRIAALLGVREGPGYLVLVGPAARAAPALAGLLEDVEVVAVDPELRSWDEEAGVTRMAAGPGLPFFSGRMRGVCLDGAPGGPYLDDALRVVGPGSRLAVVASDSKSGDRTRDRLSGADVEVLLDEDGVIVARR